MLMDFPQIAEVDINPFGVDEQGGGVLDAEVILEEHSKRPNGNTDHLVISPYPSEYIKKSP